MGKRKLADELAELFNPRPRSEVDPDAADADEGAAQPIDDEQLEALDIDASRPSR